MKLNFRLGPEHHLVSGGTINLDRNSKCKKAFGDANQELGLDLALTVL